jgi:hypothetical protein
MRNLISYADLQLTQGAIFNNTIAEDYGNNEAYGIIINARCDLVHRKKNKISYLPIVSLNDWEKFDGKSLVFNQIINNYRSTLQDKLKKQSFAVSVIDFLDLIELKKLLKADTKAISILDKFFSIKTFIDDDKNNIPDEIKSDYINALRNQKEQLLDCKLNGYYFIESVDGKDDSGYVVLMNEIKYMPSIYVEKLKRGFIPDNDILNIGIFAEKKYTALMSFVKSPFIEHFMQQFSNMFIRVGIQDIQDRQKYIQDKGEEDEK